MKYFFSSPSSSLKEIKQFNIQNILLSYALDAKTLINDVIDCENIIVDSGAFSVWNTTGGKIDIEKYIEFCSTLPEKCVFVNIDVIPETGSTLKEIHKCADESFENYKYISSKLKKVLPVYHYGENLKYLTKYANETDYVGLSPANDTHEKTKRLFLKSCFEKIGTSIKTHAFGYSSKQGMLLFPFYSVDSISYKRYDVGEGMYWAQGKLKCLLYESIREWKYLEEQYTKIWEKRGVKWN